MKYPIPVVRVILENPKGKILFLKRAGQVGKNQWSLPGGKVEYGQTLERACIDELKQEVNLDIYDLKFLFHDEDLPSIVDKNHWIIFYFTANYSGGVKLNNESYDHRWLAFNNLNNYNVAFNHDKVIQRYFNK